MDTSYPPWKYCFIWTETMEEWIMNDLIKSQVWWLQSIYYYYWVCFSLSLSFLTLTVYIRKKLDITDFHLNSFLDRLVMVFNATFNNILVMSSQSVLLVDETGENNRPVPSHWQTLSHNVVSSTPRHERGSNSQL